MKETVFSNWTGVRFLRLGLGIAILVQGFLAKDAVLSLLGLLFSGMAVFNLGCCGAGNCSTGSIDKMKSSNDITYEELD